MIPAAAQTGSLFLSLSALAGVLILQGVIVARDPRDPLNRRFLFGLRVITMLFAGRVLFNLTSIEFFRFFILLGAALIPFSVLLLTEGLLRRHAPPWAKIWVAGGTIVFSIGALWWSGSIDPARLIGLLAFQTSGLLISAWLVIRRDKSSLTASENQTVERLALSLFLLIPLAAADFLTIYLGFAVQFSALAVLFLCWLTVSLGRAQAQHRAALGSFFAVVLGAGLAGLVVAQLTAMSRDEAIVSLAVILAAVLVAVLFIEARTLRAEERSQTVLRHLAEDRSCDALGFLRGLQAHPLVEGAAVIEAPDLTDLNQTVLSRIFEVRPVLRRADPPFKGGIEGDHITHLFDRFSASHILIADDAPLTLVAFSIPTLGASARVELELAAVQRMAWHMSRSNT